MQPLPALDTQIFIVSILFSPFFSFLDHCILMRVCILIELAKTWLKSDSKK